MTSPPINNDAIPLLVVGGYLGAGKTSFLLHQIKQAQFQNSAILVNDFGALNIDATLVEFAGQPAFRLENGCICCNIGASLVSTLLGILKGEDLPERIVIETSGVAYPGKVADIARLSHRLRLDGILTLIDAANIERQLQDRRIYETLVAQIENAHILLINKLDLCSSTEVESSP